jgi:hypothetical protein
MPDFYRTALESEAFGLTDATIEHRFEDEIPLTFAPRGDGVRYDMQAKAWRVRFGGTDRFETFGLEQYDAAHTLFRRLCDERDIAAPQD